MGQITVMTGPERRRRWSDEERFQILADAFAPDASVADVARRRDVSTSLIYTWRRKLREEHADAVPLSMAKVGFAEAVITEGDRRDDHDPCAAITVDLAGGSRVRISASAPSALVTATLKALQ